MRTITHLHIYEIHRTERIEQTFRSNIGHRHFPESDEFSNIWLTFGRHIQSSYVREENGNNLKPFYIHLKLVL